MKEKLLSILFGAIYLTYFVGAGLGATYFNYKVAKEEGFLSWLVFGEVIGTLKGIIWPYYAYKYIGGDSETETKTRLWSPRQNNDECFELSDGIIAKLKRMEVVREDVSFGSKIYSDGNGKYYPVFNDKKTCEVTTKIVEKEYLRRKSGR